MAIRGFMCREGVLCRETAFGDEGRVYWGMGGRGIAVALGLGEFLGGV